MMRNRWIVAGTLVLIAAACASQDKASVATTDSAAAGVAGVASAAIPAPNIVTVHAKDFVFEAPAQIPAGMTTFRLINDGANLHHLDIVRLDSGKTLADLQIELAKPAALPGWAVFQGGPNAPDPKKETSATLALQPGNYAMICFVNAPGGVPHFAKGMVYPFTVTSAPAGPAAVAPTPDMTITLTDYAFGLSTPLTAGTHTFEVRNNATQIHEIELIRLAPGKTLDSMMRWLSSPNGPPPGSAIGGIAPFIGAPNYFTADITPGNYLLFCFVPDATDGKPHFMHGMAKTITVM
jgi:hypothetical protein